MPQTILIISQEDREIEKITLALAMAGYHVVLSTRDKVTTDIGENHTDMVLMALSSSEMLPDMTELALKMHEEASLPVMVLIAREMLVEIAPQSPWDDFALFPCNDRELVLRIQRLLDEKSDKNEGRLVCGDLVMDLPKYDVFLAGKSVDLTYREYELLRFFMSNKGQVFTRESLMDRVWGYDYYGGDRTVDVHIRRLRSKIEDAKHSFIETVRYIGYRFRDGT